MHVKRSRRCEALLPPPEPSSSSVTASGSSSRIGVPVASGLDRVVGGRGQQVEPGGEVAVEAHGGIIARGVKTTTAAPSVSRSMRGSTAQRSVLARCTSHARRARAPDDGEPIAAKQDESGATGSRNERHQSFASGVDGDGHQAPVLGLGVAERNLERAGRSGGRGTRGAGGGG